MGNRISLPTVYSASNIRFVEMNDYDSNIVIAILD